MQRKQSSNLFEGRVRQTLRSAILVAGHLSEQAVRRVLSAVRHRFDEDSLLRTGSRAVVEQVSKGADAVIAKSPVPIPQPIGEALDRMQDGLGQLSHAHQDLSDIATWELHQKAAQAGQAQQNQRHNKKKKHHRHGHDNESFGRHPQDQGHEPN